MVPSEYCPVCRAVRDMRVEMHKCNFIDPDGSDSAVFEREYHCEVCGSLIRVEDVLEPVREHNEPKSSLMAVP